MWPIAYLATEHPNVSVSMGLAIEKDQAIQEALHNGRLFLVEFEGTPELATAIEWIRARGCMPPRRRCATRAAAIFVKVLQVTAPR